MAYGAAGFVPKSIPVDEIYTAITAVLSGEIWLPKALTLKPYTKQDVNIADRVASLTHQQYRILKMFAQGLLNKQIAYTLHVSEATIKAHATAIFKKLDVRNRTQAVIAIAQLDLPESEFKPR
jgi:DNA-binding NarL/FixJ family response regulator